jgi:hypothetical protein
VEGIPRSKTWPRKPISLGKAYTDWNFGSGWSNLVTVDCTGGFNSGSLSDHNNATLLWAKQYYSKFGSRTKGLTDLLGDVGGSFQISQQKSDYSGIANVSWSQGTNFRGHGPLVPSGNSYLEAGPVVPTPLDTGQLNGYGTRAIARCAPTNPLADAATFLGELREIPKIPGTALKRHGVRGSGDEYLNYQFGISPVLRDAKSFRDANAKAEAYLQNLAKRSGRYLHRRFTFPEIRTVTETDLGQIGSQFAAGPYNSLRVRRVRTVTVNAWFSGSFCYYYQLSPNESDYLRRIRKAKDVYGLDLSIEVAWNLLPFSWLADYEFNIGNIAHNLTRFSQDGLIMKYGYIMVHQMAQDVFTFGPSSWTLTSEVKQRAKANPFGFGVSPGNLSDRQWGILAALGQSKFLK